MALLSTEKRLANNSRCTVSRNYNPDQNREILELLEDRRHPPLHFTMLRTNVEIRRRRCKQHWVGAWGRFNEFRAVRGIRTTLWACRLILLVPYMIFTNIWPLSLHDRHNTDHVWGGFHQKNAVVFVFFLLYLARASVRRGDWENPRFAESLKTRSSEPSRKYFETQNEQKRELSRAAIFW